MTIKRGIVILCVTSVALAGIICLLLRDSSAVDKVVYRAGTGEVRLEDEQISSFCQLVEDLESSPVIEEEEPGEMLCGYYIYEIQYKNGKSKYIVVNATRLAIDGVAHKSSQEICDRFRNFFEPDVRIISKITV